MDAIERLVIRKAVRTEKGIRSSLFGVGSLRPWHWGYRGNVSFGADDLRWLFSSIGCFEMKKRRGAFGMISHITPIAVPIFLILFYVPLIASPFRALGWGRGAAFGAGLLLGTAYMGLGSIAITRLPSRFAKLDLALQFLVYVFPILGVFGIALRDLAMLLWHLAQ